jgi:hypothetical protein
MLQGEEGYPMTAESRCARYQPAAGDGGRERSLELAERRHRDVKAFLERARLSASDVDESFRSTDVGPGVASTSHESGTLALDGHVRAANVERHAPSFDVVPRVRRYLSAERAKYLDAIEDIRAAYVATNMRGIVVEANTVANTIFGTVPLLDRALIGFVARRDTRAFRSVLKDLASQERDEVASLHLHMRRRGGPVFVTVVSGRVVYGLAQQPVAIRWLVQPVSA